MLTALCSVLLCAFQDPAVTEDLAEMRAVFLGAGDDESLSRAARIAASMDFLYDHGFNAVFPLAWRETGPLWPCAAAKTAGGIEVDPKFVDPKFKSRDVLTEIVIEGHRAGIEVVPVIDLVCAPKKGTNPLSALDPQAQSFTREVVLELAQYHEVDGIAFDAHALALWTKLDAKGLSALGDFVTTLRTEVDKIDPSIRFVLVDGGAAQAAWMERGLFDVAVPKSTAKDPAAWSKGLTALVAEPWCAKDPSICVPFFELGRDKTAASTEFVLAAVANDRAQHVKGELFSSLWALQKDEAKLAGELAKEPYYGVALVPWRKGVAWRTKSDAIQPKAGEGQWEWQEDATGVRVLQIWNTQKGDASWTLRVVEKGNYDLYTWIPPDADVGPRAAYTVAERDAVRTRVVDPTQPKFKGWIFVGTVAMDRRESREVLKLDAEGKDPTKVTVAGPMVAVLARRPHSR